MEMVGANEGIIGIKEKYREIIEAMERQEPQGVRVVPLPDVYPAGDEFILVHMVTGRVIPPGGLPKDVDAAVANVETLMNIGLDQPVTQKYLTVAGAVRSPVTVRVPIGITIGEVIEAVGGTTEVDFGVLLGGVMMARPAVSLDVPVTKTTGGIIVLPSTHSLIKRHNAPGNKCSALAALPAINAVFARSSVRATCLDIPLSLIARCNRWALPVEQMRWSPALFTAASAISVRCFPVPRIWTPKTYASNQSRSQGSGGSYGRDLRNL